jgi:hypothetical protein
VTARAGLRPDQISAHIVRALQAVGYSQHEAAEMLAEHDAQVRREDATEFRQMQAQEPDTRYAAGLYAAEVALRLKADGWSGKVTLPAGAPAAPRTERSYWQAIADALNAAEAAGLGVGIDLDGILTDHNAWSVVWNRQAKRWDVAGFEADEPVDEDSGATA